MKQVKCDLCGKVYPQGPTRYGSGYINMSFVLHLYEDSGADIAYAPKLDFCSDCGNIVKSKLPIFIEQLAGEIKEKNDALTAIEGLPTHAERLRAQRKLGDKDE